MTVSESLSELKFNRGLVTDPIALAKDTNAASWLFLCGEEFAATEEGISYADVHVVVDESVNIVSDPPGVLDMDLARRHVAALDELPRPALVTCRRNPRSSAVVYLYASLNDEVIVRASLDGRSGSRRGDR